MVNTTGSVAVPSAKFCEPRLTIRKAAPAEPNTVTPGSTVSVPLRACGFGLAASPPMSSPTSVRPLSETTTPSTFGRVKSPMIRDGSWQWTRPAISPTSVVRLGQSPAVGGGGGDGVVGGGGGGAEERRVGKEGDRTWQTRGRRGS